MSEMKKRIFLRGFSSLKEKSEEKAPVIRQLICHDEFDLKNAELVPLRKCLLEWSIVQPISAAGLLGKVDFERFCRRELGTVGHPLLRQLAELCTVNLMRDVNITELIHLDNILWSPVYKGIVLKDSTLTVGSKTPGCPYNAARKVFIECLQLSTEIPVEKLLLPSYLSDYLNALEGATVVDKRLITNHSSTRHPRERMHRNSRANQVLRQELPKVVLMKYADPDQRYISSRADEVFTDLSHDFPFRLLLRDGFHKVIDSWARQGQRMRGIKGGSAPLVLPDSNIAELKTGEINDMSELMDALNQYPDAAVELGKLRVALHRDPFEHLYQPLYEKLLERSYNILQVEQLLNALDPNYGTSLEVSFMTRGFWHMWDVDQTKPRHLDWTNVSWAPEQTKGELHLLE